MANLNRVQLLGNLTRDPETRSTPNGHTVGELGLAVNRRVKDGENGWKDETTFVDVTIWGNTADNCAKYLMKGRPVLVEGRLQLDTWEDKDTGKKRSKLKVVADNVQFLNSGNPGGTPSESSQRARETKEQREAREAATRSDGFPVNGASVDDYDAPDDDDIPF